MSSFLRGLGLLEAVADADVTHAGHVADASNGQALETTPCRRPLFPRPGCRDLTPDNSSPENSANALASPENLLEAVKSPTSLERSSPEPNCSICLGKLQNKSFTNGCLHMFCYSCLLQWSKIKAECPLCKQSFKSIIHTVRSMQDYEEYELPACPPLRVREMDQPVNYSAHYRRAYPDNVAFMHAMHDLQAETFGIQVPFRYRTTMTSRRQSYTEYISHSWVLPPAPPTHQWRRRRHMATAEFRESIYVQDLWAQPPTGIGERYRDCSPAFYRANPAQVHRLVPWLNRELSVLFHSTSGTYPLSLILDLILRYIVRHEIRSMEFARMMRPHIGFRTDHFIHEFHSFARSHYDLVGYDQAVTYQPNPNAAPSIHVRDDDSDSDIEIISSAEGEWQEETRSAHIPFLSEPYGSRISIAGPSREPRASSSRRPTAVPSREPRAGPSTARDESDDCEVVGYVKPLHERTPEVIELSSEDDFTPEDSTPEQQSHIEITVRQPLDLPSNNDTDDHSSSTCSSGSEYLPERKKSVKKVVARKSKSRRRERPPTPPSYDYDADEVQEVPVDSGPQTSRVRTHSEEYRRPSSYFRGSDNIPHESRLEHSRQRAIVSYVRRNLLNESATSMSPRLTAHRRVDDLLPYERLPGPAGEPEQPPTFGQYLGGHSGPKRPVPNNLISSPSVSASPVEDGETISTRAHHGSVASETMPQHGSDDWDHSDSVSESDISLALLKQRTSPPWTHHPTNWVNPFERDAAYRPMKTENEPSTSTSVITSVGNVGSSPNADAGGRKPPKRLRSAILPGPSSSSSSRSENAGRNQTWQLKRRLIAPDTDSSESDSEEDTKPRIKSIVITRNFKPVIQDRSSSRSSHEERRRHIRKPRWLCMRKDSTSDRGKRNAKRFHSSSDSSS